MIDKSQVIRFTIPETVHYYKIKGSVRLKVLHQALKENNIQVSYYSYNNGGQNHHVDIDLLMKYSLEVKKIIRDDYPERLI